MPFPKKQDPWYDERRLSEGKQPNGYVLYIDYDTKEVLVRFYECEDTETYEYEEYVGKLTPMFGGTWYVW